MPARNPVIAERNVAMQIKLSTALTGHEASVRAGTTARLEAPGFIAAASSSANEFILTPIASASHPA